MSDHLSDVFRANVNAALRQRGWSRCRLAGEMGVTTDNVCKTLNNPRGVGVTAATIGRYSDALGIDAATLVTPGGVQAMASVRLERSA